MTDSYLRGLEEVIGRLVVVPQCLEHAPGVEEVVGIRLVVVKVLQHGQHDLRSLLLLSHELQHL